MNSIEWKRSTLLLVALVLASTIGCSMPKASDLKPSKLFSLDSAWPWGDDDELEPEVPSRMVGMWTDTVLHTNGQKSQRGFGGRLIFYGQDGNTPVAVEGELVVYAFDEAGRDPTDNRPTRRYVFPADQIALRHSKSAVGPSYSFFLPWDEAGGPQTEVSLICRFEPKGGAVVTSEQTRHRLPGTIPTGLIVAGQNGPQIPEGVPHRPARPHLATEATRLAADSGAQLANYVSPPVGPLAATIAPSGADVAGSQRQMTTTSIPLPNDFQLPKGSAPRPPIPATSGGQQAVPQIQVALPAVPNTSVALPPGLGAQTTTAGAAGNWAATNYRPQLRQTQPAAYSPTYGATAAAAESVNQPIHTPRPITMPTPTINHPQLVTTGAQMAHDQEVLPQQQQMVVQPGGYPQMAQQPMTIPTTGTATVTYR